MLYPSHSPSFKHEASHYAIISIFFLLCSPEFKKFYSAPLLKHTQMAFFPYSVTNCYTYTKTVHLYAYKAAPLIRVLPYSLATNLPHDLDGSVP